MLVRESKSTCCTLCSTRRIDLFMFMRANVLVRFSSKQFSVLLLKPVRRVINMIFIEIDTRNADNPLLLTSSILSHPRMQTARGHGAQ